MSPASTHRVPGLRTAAGEDSELRRALAHARARNESRRPGSRPVPARSDRPDRLDRAEWIRIRRHLSTASDHLVRHVDVPLIVTAPVDSGTVARRQERHRAAGAYGVR